MRATTALESAAELELVFLVQSTSFTFDFCEHLLIKVQAIRSQLDNR
jgi:hypothetical protein